MRDEIDSCLSLRVDSSQLVKVLLMLASPKSFAVPV